MHQCCLYKLHSMIYFIYKLNFMPNLNSSYNNCNPLQYLFFTVILLY